MTCAMPEKQKRLYKQIKVNTLTQLMVNLVVNSGTEIQ